MSNPMAPYYDAASKIHTFEITLVLVAVISVAIIALALLVLANDKRKDHK